MELKELINTIKNMVYTDMTVYSKMVQKGNRTLTGISIGKGNALPVVYMEDYEDLFQEKGYIGVAREMIKLCKEASEKFSINVDDATSWNYAKEHLLLCIAPAGTTNGVTIPYLDLELYFRVELSNDDTYKVIDAMLDTWNITKDELLRIALETNQHVALSMRDVMKDVLIEDGTPDYMIEAMLDAFQDATQIVLKNASTLFGASAIYKTELLKGVADKYESDLYIIPSSIHEVIVIPTEGITTADMDKMIRDINQSEVAPEEVLSDHVYIFRRDTMKIEW